MSLFPHRNRARRNARRGAAFLTRELPGWHHRIDLDMLTINSNRFCVLGQLFEDRRSVETSRRGHAALHLDDEASFAAGLLVWDAGRYSRALDRAWRREILALRASDPGAPSDALDAELAELLAAARLDGSLS